MKIDILANCTIQYMLKNKDTDMPKFCPITNIDIPLSIDVADDVVPYIKIYLNNIEEYELAKKEKRIANEQSYDVNDIFISSWYKILKKAYKDIITGSEGDRACRVAQTPACLLERWPALPSAP